MVAGHFQFKGEMTAVLKTNIISLFCRVVVCMTIRTFSSLEQCILMKKRLTCYYKLPRDWLHGNNEAEVNMFSCWLEHAFMGVIRVEDSLNNSMG